MPHSSKELKKRLCQELFFLILISQITFFPSSRYDQRTFRAFTVSVTLVVWPGVLLLVPVMVRGYVPPRVADEVVIVSLDEVPVIVTGLKVPETPAGRPAILRATGPVKPPDRVMAMV